ncbi:MAG: hypothetical protein OXE54_08345 [Gammaproteobacteria bacterium]|nr:hypothetical protein [Gammaproteobacteria bacterium]MCY4296974.1 hypothetical protein [Gammaproteobacteria bacterium]
MLRALAEYVMAGRRQAATAIVLLGLPPLVNLLPPMLVAMVILRKGLPAGSFLLLWAMLPVGFWLFIGNAVPLLVLTGVTMLACVLRATQSWQSVALTSIAVGAMFEIFLRAQPLVLDLLFEQMDLYIRANNLEGVSLADARQLMTTLAAAIYMVLSVALVMLGRSMQAMVINPGGFRQEFHQFRLRQPVALALVGMIVLINLVAALPGSWALYPGWPLALAGLALAHALVARRKASALWLVAMYFLLVFPAMLYLLVLAAIIDSWYDFRARLPKGA